jgi:hypothetical protein
MTFELPASVERELRDLAEVRSRRVPELIEEAVRQYLESASVSERRGRGSWEEIRQQFPRQWLLVEAIAAHSSEGKRVLDDIAVLEAFQEASMKKKLAWDPRFFVNVYTCQTRTPKDGTVGYSPFPFFYPENSTMHGIALDPITMPASGHPELGVYGLTLAHEMGHYLGVYHTFQGGCADGDEVGDTPAQAVPHFACNVGADTCAGGGVDDMFNFMNYTPDTCMDHFTAGQIQRMINITSAFRPNLVN